MIRMQNAEGILTNNNSKFQFMQRNISYSYNSDAMFKVKNTHLNLISSLFENYVKNILF